MTMEGSFDAVAWHLQLCVCVSPAGIFYHTVDIRQMVVCKVVWSHVTLFHPVLPHNPQLLGQAKNHQI